ncbi:CDC27 family protein [Sulfuricurvum sp.]|uniref:tetratricopeptide repeat protein n=1 Tax=Sulfuricurvum sp. TaxID=2025608 RepID=UPI00261EFA04|nr:CDC27 family protein [Sulfuricurvum sp.]MDD2266459.1 CDC27 family protein [Sulfuricurvum sp.]MDD2782667.1 CDC27 family protein [Sulfuricurvum sp.]
MLNIKNLERRWLKYKILSYMPYILVFMISIVLIIGISIWKHLDQSEIQVNDTHKQSVIPVTVVKPSIQPVIPEENTTFLEPSMDFIQSFQSVPVSTETSDQQRSNVITKPVQAHTTAVQTPKVLTVPEYTPPSQAAPVVSSNTNNNQLISIKVDESKLDITSLERRFKETSNANLGLFIARYYYEHGNYDGAYNYALKTNNANSRIDESWIIFAKSLVKLGKTDQAKKTLQVYISQSNSENAKGLLNSIENGNFK